MASAGDRLQIVIGAKDELSAQLRQTRKELTNLGRTANDMQRRMESGEEGLQDEIEQTRRAMERSRVKMRDLETQQKKNNAEFKKLGAEGAGAAMRLTRSFDAVSRHLGLAEDKADWLRRALERLDNGAYTFRAKWTAALTAVQTRMTRLRESAAFQGLMSFARGGVATAGIVAGAGAVMGLQNRAQIENQRIALEQLLGTRRKADETMKWIMQTANETPFGMTDITAATQKLLGFGFSLEETKKKVLTIGDVAAGTGTGAEGIDQITRALGQMQAKQKITGEEMMQLTEAGIPAWKILAKQMGMSTKELMEMASSQGGGSALFEMGGLDKIFKGLDKTYGGVMKKQARTLGGRWSTFTDTLRTELGKLFGGKTGKGLKGLLKWAAEEMPKAFKTLRPYIRDFSAMIERNWPTISSIFKAIGWVLTNVVGKAVVSTYAGVKMLFIAIGKIFGVLKGMWEGVKSLFTTIKNWFGGVLGGIGNAFNAWADGLRNVINTVIGWLNKIPGVNIDLITEIPDGARWAGGPVAAGGSYLVGEIGPELFVPSVGSAQMVGANGPEVRDFHTSGTVIPSAMVGAYMAAQSSGGVAAVSPGVNIGELHVHDRWDAERELQALLRREERIRRERR